MVVVVALTVLGSSPAGAKLRCTATPACASGATLAAARALVETACPCDTFTRVKDYKRCTKAAIDVAAESLGAALDKPCRKGLKRAVKNSLCGRNASFVLCNKTNRKGRTVCKVARTAKCVDKPGRSSPCPGFQSCADACATGGGCAASSTTTTLPGGTTTTLPGSTTTTTVTSTTTTTTLSFMDASPEALTRLDEVMAATRDMLNAGGSLTDAIAFLEAEPDVADVRLDAFTILFTVRDVLAAIHDGAASQVITETPAALATGARSSLPPTLAVEAPGTTSPDPPVGQRMLGEDRDGDGVRDVEKKALVISPYAYQLTDRDAAPAVAAVLSGVPDYQGRVTLAKNDTADDRLPLSLYTTWNEYDLIFLSAHGGGGLIGLGYYGPACRDVRTDWEAVAADKRKGLVCLNKNVGTVENPNWRGQVAVTPEFFAAQYEGGLKKKLMWLGACSTLRSSIFADALIGNDSLLFGWDKAVEVNAAKRVAAEVLGDAAMKGFPAWRSFVRVCTGGNCMGPTGASLTVRYDGPDLRIREGLIVFPPFETGTCFTDTMLPLDVTCPSCFQLFPMAVASHIEIEGVVPVDMTLRTDPQKFAREQLRLFTDADGVEQDSALPLTTDLMVNVGEGAWGTNETPATLFIDNSVCPGDVVEYRPKVMLPAYLPGAEGNTMRDFMYDIEGPFFIPFVDGPTP